MMDKKRQNGEEIVSSMKVSKFSLFSTLFELFSQFLLLGNHLKLIFLKLLPPGHLLFELGDLGQLVHHHPFHMPFKNLIFVTL